MRSHFQPQRTRTWNLLPASWLLNIILPADVVIAAKVLTHEAMAPRNRISFRSIANSQGRRMNCPKWQRRSILFVPQRSRIPYARRGMLFAFGFICSILLHQKFNRKAEMANHYGFTPPKHAAALFFDRCCDGDRRLIGYVLSHASPEARARWPAFADQRARTAEMGTHRLRCLAYPTSSYAPKDDC